MAGPSVAVKPFPAPFATDAVEAGGGTVTDDPANAEGLVWLDPGDPDALREVLGAAPGLRWVQLPSAGIERMSEAGLIDHDRIWTCAKGSFAEPVAEHALTLALAGLRQLPTRVRARSWGQPAGLSLYDQRVTILGGGGITAALLGQLAPFRVEATVVRRRPDPIPGAARTVPVTELSDVLPGSLVVFLALALTPSSERIIGAAELEQMDETAWLVNVARGRHVDTEALVAALGAGSIGGAALDVTDPEPLPDGHPLWTAPSCIITPHTADTLDMVIPHLAERIRAISVMASPWMAWSTLTPATERGLPPDEACCHTRRSPWPGETRADQPAGRTDNADTARPDRGPSRARGTDRATGRCADHRLRRVRASAHLHLRRLRGQLPRGPSTGGCSRRRCRRGPGGAAPRASRSRPRPPPRPSGELTATAASSGAAVPVDR